MAEFTHQISRIGWSRSNPEQHASPFVDLRSLTDQSLSRIPLQGYEFNWQLSEIRYCVGYSEEDGTYHKCPYKNEANNSHGQCIHCSKQVGFEQAFFYGGDINARMQKYLSEPHFVYLAYFQPNIIKVGTAHSSRNTIRTLEQDALIAVFIAESDGFNIQTIERAISKIGYTEAVKSSTKLRYVSSVPDKAMAQDLLYSSWQRIANQIQESEITSKLFDFNTESEFHQSIHEHLSNPAIFFPDSHKQLQQREKFEVLAGEFKGLRGKYLITEQNSALHITRTTRITGKHLLVPETKLEMPKPQQRSLF